MLLGSWQTAFADMYKLSAEDEAFLDQVQERTFRWFWEATPAKTGLTPDRWPSNISSSVAAIGFALSAYPIGAERGWVGREAARHRTLETLRFLTEAPQGPSATGVAGYKGFFYHFLDMESGTRFRDSELSSVDTALLLGGVLLAQAYFDGDEAEEAEIRDLAQTLYERVDWTWMQKRSPLISMGWEPGKGFIKADWRGYNEGMLVYLLAMGSPTYPVDPSAWKVWTDTYDKSWNRSLDAKDAGPHQAHLSFAPMFGHQYSHVWVDFRGIKDAEMRARGLDYFENSRRATYSQRAYAIANPSGWDGYGADIWGLTASDGPGIFKARVNGDMRQFHAYWARGYAPGDVRDDGTLVPTAAGGSVPFAPEITIPALKAMVDRYGDHLFTDYGFRDAFNPTLKDEALLEEGATLSRGDIVPGVGWFDDDYLGIDQGPILLMIENYRSGMIWDLMKKNSHLIRGLCLAGFDGGWIKGKCS
ncbi:hypothetical protein GCM10007972_15830 [Iodidimonas muriae]|uniref:Glycoamylase-like domain-containing protein n=1 Tax=Iodidimonas muriae TaxID=261467 RepID=A0ABQ2LDJ6_9PROT|nr:glucoamylase family protein [Iodidimonas muriae]GER07956.1 hypothetical protein JCM17843_22660 [Kordiimonadales bacterium JCM 17843]GGO11782.1 hypothetical protein GCM10007972_15830 [Iodidimonas muriae]